MFIRICDKCNEFDVNQYDSDDDTDIDDRKVPYSYFDEDRDENYTPYQGNELCGSDTYFCSRYVYKVIEYQVFQVIGL